MNSLVRLQINLTLIRTPGAILLEAHVPTEQWSYFDYLPPHLDSDEAESAALASVAFARRARFQDEVAAPEFEAWEPEGRTC